MRGHRGVGGGRGEPCRGERDPAETPGAGLRAAAPRRNGAQRVWGAAGLREVGRWGRGGGRRSYLGTQRLSSSEQSPWARAGRIFAGAAAVRAAGGRAPLGQGRRGSALLSARFVCCGLFACLCFPLSSLSLAPCAPGLGSPGRLCHPPGMLPPPPPAAPAPAEGCAPPPGSLPSAAASPSSAPPRLSPPWPDGPGGRGGPRPSGRAPPPLPRAPRGSGAAAGVGRAPGGGVGGAGRPRGAAAPAGPAGTWGAAGPPPPPAGVAGWPAERAGSRPERPGSAGRGAAAAAALAGIALRRALLSARSPSPDTSRQEPAGEGRGRGWQRGGEAACRTQAAGEGAAGGGERRAWGAGTGGGGALGNRAGRAEWERRAWGGRGRE